MGTEQVRMRKGKGYGKGGMRGKKIKKRNLKQKVGQGAKQCCNMHGKMDRD